MAPCCSRRDRGVQGGRRSVVDTAHGYRLEVPATAPSGEPITMEQEMTGDIHRLHAATADGHEVYLEIASWSSHQAHHPAIAEQRRSLRERAPAARIGRAREARPSGRPGTSFRFDGDLGGQRRVRRFTYVDVGPRTFRIVVDPTSPATRRILATLVFVDAEAAG
jgi:hypothetical protein